MTLNSIFPLDTIYLGLCGNLLSFISGDAVQWIIMFLLSNQMLIITTLSYINSEQFALETHQIVSEDLKKHLT